LSAAAACAILTPLAATLSRLGDQFGQFGHFGYLGGMGHPGYQGAFHMGHFFGFVFLFLLLGLGLLGAVLAGIVRLLRGEPRRAESQEETRIIQEMYNTMNRLEERVESLETILIERDREEKS
jgi:phage shock protein B